MRSTLCLPYSIHIILLPSNIFDLTRLSITIMRQEESAYNMSRIPACGTILASFLLFGTTTASTVGLVTSSKGIPFLDARRYLSLIAKVTGRNGEVQFRTCLSRGSRRWWSFSCGCFGQFFLLSFLVAIYAYFVTIILFWLKLLLLLLLWLR
jgi:hypothetical protein